MKLKFLLCILLSIFLFSCEKEVIVTDEDDIEKETISLVVEAEGNTIKLEVLSSAIDKMKNIVIYWGTDSDELTNKIELNSKTKYTLTGLPEDDYYFRATADYFDSTYDINVSIESELVECSIELPKDLSTDDAVDLGLSVLWARCDLGAENPWENGIQCVWGDPSGLLDECCDESLCGGAIPPIEISGTSLDIATVKLGNGWRLPTKEECEELETKTEQSSVTLRGQKGILFKAENGNELFMPVAYTYSFTNDYYKDYWTGTLNEAYNEAYYFDLTRDNDYSNAYVHSSRRNDFKNIRPVRDRNYVSTKE